MRSALWHSLGFLVAANLAAACSGSDPGPGGAAGSGAAGAGGSGGSAEAGTGGATAGAAGTGGTAEAGADGPEDDGSQPEPDASPDVVTGDVDAQPEAGNADCALWDKLDGELAAAQGDAQKLGLLDSFVLQVQASSGFPLRCAQAVHFVFRTPQGMQAPHVAGDFNGWSPTASAMSLVAGNAWRATITMDAGPNRYMYKYTDGSQWVADPLSRRFGYDDNGQYALVSGGTSKGHLERLGEVSGAGLKPRPVTVYVPPGYEAGTAQLPVLYAHDGQNLFDPAAMWGSWKLDATVEALLAEGKLQPLLVVGIHNTSDRMDEYTHVQDKLGSTMTGGKADAYYQLVTTSVMPLVAKQYRVKTGPQNTWTMGSSLGGLISLYFGMKHPETFGRVAGLSSTAGWGSMGAGVHNKTVIEIAQESGKQALLIYLDSGGGPGSDGCPDTDNDGVQDDSETSSDNYCETAQLRDVYAAAGYVFDTDLFHWWEPGAGHNEAAWAARLSHPLLVLAGQ